MNVAGRPLQKTAPWPSGNGRGSYLSEGVRTWFWWKNPGVLDLPDPMTQRCEEAHPFETLASQSSQLHGPRGDTRSHLCSLERSTWYSTKRDHLTLPFPSSCPVRCARDREGYFADRLYKSMTGAGTDEETLIHVFVTRAEVDLQGIKEKFQEKYQKSLSDMVRSDTSGDFQRLLVALLH
uniref:Annexin n=1 Tax=Rousettus aegyptiacus TaxID=9407 RepID=A0A7J8C0S8_ROUAE|nr:annexin A13 [Rousettus aegyptiacus]